MGKKRRILYVDDEEINVSLFNLSFRNEFEVYSAKSAKEGIKILDSQPEICVVISDLKMPEMDGLEFIKFIKGKRPEIVCMLLTGYVESEVMLEGFNKDLLFRYLVKPWKKEKLLESIEDAFKKVLT